MTRVVPALQSSGEQYVFADGWPKEWWEELIRQTTNVFFSLTFSPGMAGYGTMLGALGRCRHMAEPIKVFWQPH